MIAKNLNWKLASIVLAFTLIVFWLILLSCKGIEPGISPKALQEVYAAIAYLLPTIGFFNKYLWRLIIFRKWLVLVPDINGTWKGSLQSDWINPKTEAPPRPIDAYMVIRQSLFSISCIQMTAESKSWSRSSAISMDSENQRKSLDFIYSNKPEVLLGNRSTDHEGACSLEIIDGNTRKLKGKYWTLRNTKGSMEFTFETKKARQEFSA